MQDKTKVALFLICLMAIVSIPAFTQQQPAVAIREASTDSMKIAVIEQKLRDMDEARELQITEIHRRLDELNHHREQADKDKADFVNILAFTAYQKDVQNWRDEVNKQLAGLSGSSSGIAGFKDATLATIVALVSLAGFLFMLYTRNKEKPPSRR
jgi:hypothetical protein